MVETGIIERMYVKPSLQMMGADILLAIIHTDGLEDDVYFIEDLKRHPMIEQISVIASCNGGMYIVNAMYRGSEGLAELSSFLRKHKHVMNLELHTLVVERGRKVELNYVHLKVLGCLIGDPRISMKDIRKKISLSIKKIRKTIEFLQDSGALHFGIRVSPGANGSIDYIVRIVLDEKKINHEGLMEWLLDEFPKEYWQTYISATEPVVFARFVVDAMQDAESILRNIRSNSTINSASGLVLYSSREIGMPGESEIIQMIEAISF
jgi:DNA-binding Lrp family transcriptional regulator